MKSEDQLDAVFQALADPTRRAMLARLAKGEATVTELAAPFDLSQPAISKHVKVLERAGLITRSRSAQTRPCRLDAKRLKAVRRWADAYCHLWDDSFSRLDTLLAPPALQTKKGSRHASRLRSQK